MTFDEWWDKEGRDIFQRSEGWLVARAAWNAASGGVAEMATNVVLIDGKQYRHCGCAPRTGTCPNGIDRKLGTTELSRCLLPVGERPKCQKCAAEDSMEHVKTDYHGMETHYDQCVVCDHRTQPE